MAEKKRKDGSEDLSSRLQSAKGDINRISADAEAREAAKNQKSEKSSAASAAELKRQQKAEARRAARAAEQRQAELEYAEDYRRKLQRDRKRAAEAEKEARAERARKAEELRAREIAEALEKERRHAAERGERSDALLEKLIAAREAAREAALAAEKANEEAVAPPAAELLQIAEEILEEPVSKPVTEPVEEPLGEDVKEKKSSENPLPVDFSIEIGDKEYEDTVINITANSLDGKPESGAEPMTVTADDGNYDERHILNIADDRVVLNISGEGATVKGGDKNSGVHIQTVTAEEALLREGTALSVKQNVTVSTEDKEEELPKVTEEIVDAVNPEYDDPITSSNPEVAAIKLRGRSVGAKSEFRKYISESRKALKEFNTKIANLEEALDSGYTDGALTASVLVDILGAISAIVEIRCDNLRIVTRFGQRRYIPEIKKYLLSDIERYNEKVSEFATRTGERLTRLSPELAQRICEGTGAEILPVFSYSKKYVELREKDGESVGLSAALNLPLDTDISLEGEPKEPVKNTIYQLIPVEPAVSAAELIVGENPSDSDSYAVYLKGKKRAEKRINSEIAKLRVGVTRAEKENAELDRELGKKRAAFDKMLINMDHSIAVLRVKRDKTLEALSRKLKKCEDIEEKIELNRTYIESEKENAELIVGCLALEREKLILAFKTLEAAKVTSSNKIIEKAKSDLISEMARYNKTIDECSRYIEVEFTPITADLADEILAGRTNVEIPKIALLRELVETVGDVSRTVGARKAKKKSSLKTVTVESDPAAVSPKKKSFNPIKTVNARFFMGGVARGNIAGADNTESAAAVTEPVSEPAVEEVYLYGENQPISTAFTEQLSEENPILLPEEAPIAVAKPRMLVKTFVDENGVENIVKEPCPEKLIDDEIGIYEQVSDMGGEAVSSDAPARGIYDDYPIGEAYPLDGMADPKRKKIKLRQLPPPERHNSEELRPVVDEGPLYPGNTVNKDYLDDDDFDPNDYSRIPSVVEVDDNSEDIESDILIKPTVNGLKRHLAYVRKKIRKTVRARKRLEAEKKKAESVAKKARISVKILGEQKRLVDWYCNGMTSCCDLGNSKKARSLAGALRSEIKRYNRYVRDYEKLTGDRLTEASLDIPALILEGEDYPIIPKVKLREFEAPEDGVVYGDGVTENADYIAEFTNDVVLTEKDLNKRLNESSREISKLRGNLDDKIKEKMNAWGIDKTIYTVECFGIQKKIVDTLASDLRAACQVSSVKKMQSLKKELTEEAKQYNRLVNEYKTVSGNSLTRADENMASEIISGNLYTPLPRVGCVYMNEDDGLDGEIRAMARGASYGIGGVAFRTKVTSQANKDISLITRRADYHISMLESERDILSYRFGKEPHEIKRERREIAKRINQLRTSHKTALKYENNDNRRYYAAVTANPATMELKNKKADRNRVAALRSKIIDLLNERDIVNGKLIALYAGTGIKAGSESVNQQWRRVKNKAAAKSKKRQKSTADMVKNMPVSQSEKTKVYNLMNERLDAESTIALTKYRIRKEKLNKQDKLCANQDIKAQKARIKELDKNIHDIIKTIEKKVSEAQAISSWYVAFIVLLVLVIFGLVFYLSYMSPIFAAIFA